MKTFKDLNFKQHRIGGDAEQAIMKFPDGSEISVICGYSGFYSSEGTFEMMSNRTMMNNGIRGYLSAEKITQHMKYIQKNPLKSTK